MNQPYGDVDGPQPPISDYAMVGDTRTAALVSRDGSIDWLCWPRYDADPLFGRLLDPPNGGHFKLWAKGGHAAVRAYHDRSPVLETSINAPGGKARLVDAMPFRRQRGPIVVRRLECLAGRIEPVLEYAPARRNLVKLVGWEDKPLRAGESITAILIDRGDEYAIDRAVNLVQRSERWWNQWCARISPGGHARRPAHPFADHAASAHLHPFRRASGRPHYLAARGDRWRAQLGLPLCLAARCQRRCSGDDFNRPRGRSGEVPRLARPPCIRSARASRDVPD